MPLLALSLRLDDPVVSFILGVPAFAVPAAVALWIYKRQATRERKALTYTVVATKPLSKHAQDEPIEVLYGGVSVRQPQVTALTVLNAGNAPIKPDDFDGPLRINLPEGARLLSVSVEKSSPADLGPVVRKQQATDLTIAPLLLNPQDRFRVRLVTADALGEIRLQGRIAGVKQVERETDPVSLQLMVDPRAFENFGRSLLLTFLASAIYVGIMLLLH